MQFKIHFYFQNIFLPVKILDEKANSLFEQFAIESETTKKFFILVDRMKKNKIVDIGSGYGTFCLYGKYLPLSTFYSFEECFENYDLMNKNISLNQLLNVKTYWNTESTTTNIDEIFFQENLKLDFMRINAYFINDYTFLSKCKNTITKDKPVILIQQINQNNQFCQNFRNFLIQIGYINYKIGENEFYTTKTKIE
jgi:hypothetical protein